MVCVVLFRSLSNFLSFPLSSFRLLVLFILLVLLILIRFHHHEMIPYDCVGGAV